MATEFASPARRLLDAATVSEVLGHVIVAARAVVGGADTSQPLNVKLAVVTETPAARRAEIQVPGRMDRCGERASASWAE